MFKKAREWWARQNDVEAIAAEFSKTGDYHRAAAALENRKIINNNERELRAERARLAAWFDSAGQTALSNGRRMWGRNGETVPRSKPPVVGAKYEGQTEEGFDLWVHPDVPPNSVMFMPREPAYEVEMGDNVEPTLYDKFVSDFAKAMDIPLDILGDPSAPNAQDYRDLKYREVQHREKAVRDEMRTPPYGSAEFVRKYADATVYSPLSPEDAELMDRAAMGAEARYTPIEAFDRYHRAGREYLIEPKFTDPAKNGTVQLSVKVALGFLKRAGHIGEKGCVMTPKDAEIIAVMNMIDPVEAMRRMLSETVSYLAVYPEALDRPASEVLADQKHKSLWLYSWEYNASRDTTRIHRMDIGGVWSVQYVGEFDGVVSLSRCSLKDRPVSEGEEMTNDESAKPRGDVSFEVTPWTISKKDLEEPPPSLMGEILRQQSQARLDAWRDVGKPFDRIPGHPDGYRDEYMQDITDDEYARRYEREMEAIMKPDYFRKIALSKPVDVTHEEDVKFTLPKVDVEALKDIAKSAPTHGTIDFTCATFADFQDMDIQEDVPDVDVTFLVLNDPDASKNGLYIQRAGQKAQRVMDGMGNPWHPIVNFEVLTDTEWVRQREADHNAKHKQDMGNHRKFMTRDWALDDPRWLDLPGEPIPDTKSPEGFTDASPEIKKAVANARAYMADFPDAVYDLPHPNSFVKMAVAEDNGPKSVIINHDELIPHNRKPKHARRSANKFTDPYMVVAPGGVMLIREDTTFEIVRGWDDMERMRRKFDLDDYEFMRPNELLPTVEDILVKIAIERAQREL